MSPIFPYCITLASSTRFRVQNAVGDDVCRCVQQSHFANFLNLKIQSVQQIDNSICIHYYVYLKDFILRCGGVFFIYSCSCIFFYRRTLSDILTNNFQ